MFLKISQNSQENTCARVSFSNKVAGLRPTTLSRKRLWHKCFPLNFAKFSRTIKNTLKYRVGEMSLKAPFIIYADLECILIKEQSCQNNTENSYTEKKVKHKPSGYSWGLICLFDATKTRHNFYRGKGCIERFYKVVKEFETEFEIINYKEKK